MSSRIPVIFPPFLHCRAVQTILKKGMWEIFGDWPVYSKVMLEVHLFDDFEISETWRCCMSHE